AVYRADATVPELWQLLAGDVYGRRRGAAEYLAVYIQPVGARASRDDSRAATRALVARRCASGLVARGAASGAARAAPRNARRVRPRRPASALGQTGKI